MSSAHYFAGRPANMPVALDVSTIATVGLPYRLIFPSTPILWMQKCTFSHDFVWYMRDQDGCYPRTTIAKINICILWLERKVSTCYSDYCPCAIAVFIALWVCAGAWVRLIGESSTDTQFIHPNACAWTQSRPYPYLHPHSPTPKTLLRSLLTFLFSTLLSFGVL